MQLGAREGVGSDLSEVRAVLPEGSMVGNSPSRRPPAPRTRCDVVSRVRFPIRCRTSRATWRAQRHGRITSDPPLHSRDGMNSGMRSMGETSHTTANQSQALLPLDTLGSRSNPYEEYDAAGA